MAGVIVLDASVLIAYLDADDAHHGAAQVLLAEAIEEECGANPLTLAEVLVVPARLGRLEAAQLVLDELEVSELAFPPDTAVRLAQLRAETGLRMPDCCVLLSAETTAATEATAATVATFDDRLAAAAEARNLRVRRRNEGN